MSCLRHTSFKQEIRRSTNDCGLECVCVWHSRTAAAAVVVVCAPIIVIARTEYID